MLTIYTDGSSRGNPGLGGWGFVAFDGEPIPDNLIAISAYQTINNTTNNREELKAVIYAMKYAQKLNKKAIIYSDSSYVVNTYNDWMHKWKVNNWTRGKNKPVENLDLIQSLYNNYTNFSKKCQLEKVNGHAGEWGNELADALAADNLSKVYKYISEDIYNKLFYNFDFEKNF